MPNTANIYVPADDTEKQFIISIWRITEAGPEPRREIILPKGTVEIIFNSSDSVVYLNPARRTRMVLPPCFVNGINSRPFNLIKSGTQQFVGIQMNAIGMRGLFNVSPKQFANSVVEGDSVCRALSALGRQIADTQCFTEQVTFIRTWLHDMISHSALRSTTREMQELFCSQQFCGLTVQRLCDVHHVSDRHLRRLADEWLGMNTESWIIYNRYLTSLYLLHQQHGSLSQIGLESGYYDQAHFIREFKTFTGFTPGRYQKAANGIPGHILASAF